ncbi:MAG: type II secretion system F family protein [Euryarchaeota archaeon]|nr:type II secretion system F family protein [Euryarchaeota archaeon]
MTNVILRFVDWVGEGTLSRTEWTYRKALELSTALKEQDEVARVLLGKKKAKEEERRKVLEEKLSKIIEAVRVESGKEVEGIDFGVRREELKVPFSERLASVISDKFLNYSKKMESFFVNIQEDLYRANIIMPASKYISLSAGISAIAALAVGIFFGILLASITDIFGGLLGLSLGIITFFFLLVFAKIYPKSKIKSRSEAFSRELPFALRHMATQLTSGSGLLETMRSVSLSDYGVLSEEFRRAILEIERGSTIEEAYERMNLRINSAGLKKASRQIVSTLRTGGNLANTLKLIADEVATEMRMRLKDFIQTLNTFSLMYMFIVVVAPVLITTLVIAMGIAMKALPISPEILWLLYLTFFGASLYMSFMVKRFEPKV